MYVQYAINRHGEAADPREQTSSVLPSHTIHENICVVCYVCAFFTLPSYFHPSAFSTTSVRADSSILEDIQVMWPRYYSTEILRCQVCSKHSGQFNVMSSYWIRQARHTHPITYRNKGNKEKTKTKKTNRKRMRKKKTSKKRTVVPPLQGMEKNLKRTSWKKRRKTPLFVNQKYD